MDTEPRKKVMVRMPKALHEKVKQIAREKRISMNTFYVEAITEAAIAAQLAKEKPELDQT